MPSNFQDSKGQEKKPSANGPDKAGLIFEEMFQEFIVASSMGLWAWLKSFFTKKAILTIPITAALAFLSYWIAHNGSHLLYLHRVEPRIFTPRIVNWAWRKPMLYHYLIMAWLIYSPLFLAVGIWVRGTRTKFQKLFQSARLTNGLGDTPKLLYKQRIDKHRTKYAFDANGVGISEFEAKREQIESHFKTNIESIKQGAHSGQVLITFTKQAFPTKEEVKVTEC
jgi:hypothetical protein